jgi:hypothetical protein
MVELDFVVDSIDSLGSDSLAIVETDGKGISVTSSSPQPGFKWQIANNNTATY